MFLALLLAVSLSIDALGIGMSYGIRGIKIPFVTKVIIFVLSAAIIAASIHGGNIIAAILPEIIAKYIGVVILIVMGIWIIAQSINKKDKKGCEYKDFNILIKSMGITVSIMRTPELCDIDKSKIIEPLEAVYLAFALSFDSFGAGIGGGAAGIGIKSVPIIAAVCQILFLTMGRFAGEKIKSTGLTNEKSLIMFSGILLIVIGFVRMAA